MFYVYHKEKGDQDGGPNCELLGEYSIREEAEAVAAAWNDSNRSIREFHRAIVRIRKVKDAS